MHEKYAALLRLYEKYNRESAEETLRSGCGLPPPRTDDNGQYAKLHRRATHELIMDLVAKSRSASKRERYSRTAFHILDETIGHHPNIELDELQARSKVIVAAEKIAYFDLEPELSRETDFDRRERLAQARLRITDRKFNPVLLAGHKARRAALRRYGFDNTRQYIEQALTLDLDLLRRKMEWLMLETEEQYRKRLKWLIDEKLGEQQADIGYDAHYHFLTAFREFDELFPAKELVEKCSVALKAMGMDFDEAHNLHIDADDRPKKDSRAFSIAIDAPGDVHLVVKPRGGSYDYATFLHEAGHAWHQALTDPRLPYEFRMLNRSNALTETFAFLFECLTHSSAWLTKVIGLDPEIAKDAAKKFLIHDNILIRRYVGKLIFELEFHPNVDNDTWNRKRFDRVMTDLTGFVFDERRYLLGMDNNFMCADYLRAWIAESFLREHLLKEFGDEWFLSEKAGVFLRSLFAKGESWSAEDLVRSLGGKAWDLKPLLRRLTAE